MNWKSLVTGRPEVILGADEVGYGALAGPLVISVVAVPMNWSLKGLKDSKKLSPEKRSALDVDIEEFVVLEAVMSPERVDEMGGYNALRWLHQQAAAEALAVFPGCPMFVDGNMQIKGCTSLVKADNIVPAVMAASVHAKVFRDTYMTEVLHQRYPEYHFDLHKGYGTRFHYDALVEHGPSPCHRKSYLKFNDGKVRAPVDVPFSGPEKRHIKWSTLKDARGSFRLKKVTT